MLPYVEAASEKIESAIYHKKKVTPKKILNAFIEVVIDGTAALAMGKYADELFPNLRGRKAREWFSQILGKHTKNEYKKNGVETIIGILYDNIVGFVEKTLVINKMMKLI